MGKMISFLFRKCKTFCALSIVFASSFGVLSANPSMIGQSVPSNASINSEVANSGARLNVTAKSVTTSSGVKANVSAEPVATSSDVTPVVDNISETDSVVQGLEAYRAEDWNSATFLLRKAIAINENVSPDTLFMLIMAEMNNQDYASAVYDIDNFFYNHKTSIYTPYLKYQKGRALHYLGDYNSSILLLSDFCHENPDNEMYASALFWIAESFYLSYRYDMARGLYERIVLDFSNDAKSSKAQYRIDSIDQRSREEKLLYLLKKTGEEYLSAKESYEKQLKEYQTEGLVGIQRQLKAEKDKNIALTLELENLKKKNEELENLNNTLQNSIEENSVEVDNNILLLKKKADEIDSLINTQNGGNK